MNQMGLSKKQMIVLPKASKSNPQPLSLGPLCLGIPALSSRMEHRDHERQRVILTPSHGCCTERTTGTTVPWDALTWVRLCPRRQCMGCEAGTLLPTGVHRGF